MLGENKVLKICHVLFFCSGLVYRNGGLCDTSIARNLKKNNYKKRTQVRLSKKILFEAHLSVYHTLMKFLSKVTLRWTQFEGIILWIRYTSQGKHIMRSFSTASLLQVDAYVSITILFIGFCR